MDLYKEIKSKGIVTKIITLNGDKIGSIYLYIFGIMIYRFCIYEP
jgi:hypothetical protein